MEISINDKKENLILERAEVRFSIFFEGPTPAREEVKQELCKKLGADPSLLVIDKIDQGYGKTKVSGYAKVYKDKDAMRVDYDYKTKRDTKKKKEGADGEAPQQPAAEKKAEKKPEKAEQKGAEEKEKGKTG